MAIQTIYITNGASIAPGWFGPTQLNGTAPTAANSNVGWTPGKSAITVPYYRGRLGSTTTTGTTQAASWNASTTSPTAGTGNSSTTAGDSFIVGPLTGTFANTAWTFNWNMRATTAGCVGHVNMRMWRGTNAAGTGATQVLANTAGATVTLSTTADTNSSITASPGAMTLNNEYLFFQVEWQETTVGSSNSDDVRFHIGTASITTADFLATATGTLNVTEISDTLAAQGGPRVVGTLAVTQANQTIVAQGGPRVVCTLTVTEILDVVSATGTVVFQPVTGTLSITEIPDTLTATGTVSGGVVGDHVTWGDSGTQVALSNGNLDAFGTNSSGWTSVRANLPRKTGKYYFEIEYQGNAGSTYFACGVMDDSTPAGGGLDTYIPFQCGGTRDDGYQFVNGFTGSTGDGLGTVSVGDRIGGAVNLDTQELYLSHNGIWLGASDPVAGANPRVTWYGQAGINIYPAAMLYYVGARIHSNASTLSYVSPSGFTPWDGTPDTRPPTDPSFIAHWKLSDGSGTDLTGHSNDGVFNGGATASTDGPIGNVAVFDGSTGYVANDQIVNISYVSLSVWVKTPPGGVGQIAGFGNGYYSPTCDKDLNIRPDGTLNWYIYPGGPIFLSSTVAVNDGNWHHVVATYNGSAQNIYIDGVLNASQAQAGGSFAQYSQPNIFLGGAGHPNGGGGGNWFTGSLDDFRVYSRGLTGSEVAALYAEGGGVGPVTGTLNVTQVNQTVAATGGVTVTGTLARTQVNHTVSSTAVTVVGGTLNVVELLDTVTASGSVGFPLITGTLNLTQANQTVTATGGPVARGTLNLTQANQTVISTGAVGISGALSVNQAPQTIAATGGTTTSGTLNAIQANQTVTATGGTTASGTLIVTQAAQTLVAMGTVRVSGTLAVTQAAQTLVATGTVGVTGTLNLGQAPHTLSGTGIVLGGISGGVNVVQASQTVTATGTVTGYVGNLNIVQANQTLVASGAVRVSATLNQLQAPQTLAATGVIVPSVSGSLNVTQAPQTLSATGVIVLGISGSLNVTQVSHTISASGYTDVSGGLTVITHQTLVADGEVDLIGGLDLAQADQTLRAYGGLGNVWIPAVPGLVPGVPPDRMTSEQSDRIVAADGSDRLVVVSSLPAPDRTSIANGSYRVAYAAGNDRTVMVAPLPPVLAVGRVVYAGGNGRSVSVGGNGRVISVSAPPVLDRVVNGVGNDRLVVTSPSRRVA